MKVESICEKCGAVVTVDRYYNEAVLEEEKYICDTCGFSRHYAYGELQPDDSEYLSELREKIMTEDQKAAVVAYNEILSRVAGKIVVFDIDGTLVAYDYGDGRHSMEGWEESFSDKENNPYAKAKGIHIFQKIIEAIGAENVYACSVADDYELKAKSDFVTREYGVSKEHHLFCHKKEEKIALLKKIKDEYPGWQIVFVDDTVGTLDLVYKALPDVITLHNSLFLTCCGI